MFSSACFFGVGQTWFLVRKSMGPERLNNWVCKKFGQIWNTWLSSKYLIHKISEIQILLDFEFLRHFTSLFCVKNQFEENWFVVVVNFLWDLIPRELYIAFVCCKELFYHLFKSLWLFVVVSLSIMDFFELMLKSISEVSKHVFHECVCSKYPFALRCFMILSDLDILCCQWW